MPRPSFDLLIVSDEGPELSQRVARALAFAEPGRVALQLRERALPSAALLELARSLRTITRARGALLLINDRVDIALAAEADGVHLPEAGFSPPVARSRLGAGALIGASRHDAAGLVAAASEGADYATLSPVHVVAGKAPPLGIAGFARLAAGAPLPVYALGGVRLDDIPALRSAGARGVAVRRAVLSADDPGELTQRLLEALRLVTG